MRIVLAGVFLFLVCFLPVAAFPVDAEQPAGPNSAMDSLTPSVSPAHPGTKTVSPADPSGVEAMTDIIDIRPIEDIGYDTRIIRYALYAVCVILIIVLALYLMDRLLRKRKQKTGVREMAIPPDQLALERLAALESQDDPGEKEFYFRLTAIVREYIKGRFSLDAPEMTTEELLPVISSLHVDRALASGLKELLRSTDPVKFAGFSVSRDKMAGDMAFARHFVEATRNVPENPEDISGE